MAPLLPGGVRVGGAADRHLAWKLLFAANRPLLARFAYRPDQRHGLDE